jgi:hypothetical protein
MKTIVRRPIFHYVIIIVYIAAPVANILLVWLFSDATLGLIFNRLFTGYGYLATVWLVTAPLVGLSLFFVNKYTWYLFIAHSLLVLADYGYKWIGRPAYYATTVGGGLNIILLTGNLALVAIVLYIIQKDFRSPYFQVLQRSFREQKRIAIRYFIKLDGVDYRITDLSTEGCFVSEPNIADSESDDYRFELSLDKRKIEGGARLMREIESGYGLMFVSLSRGGRSAISKFLRQRFALRYLVSLPGTWQKQGRTTEVIVHDLSSGGCFVATDDISPAEGERGRIEMRIPGHNQVATGKIAWKNTDGSHQQKPQGFGVTFDRKQRAFVRHIVRKHGKMQLVR